MKFFSKWGIFVVGAVALSQASAFPIAPINHQCAQSGYDRSMQDLFIRVNQIGKVEKRRDLSKLQGLEAAGFTKDDIRRAETCGGIVFCPASGTDNHDYVTAFSLVSSDQVFIPAHLFFNLGSNGYSTNMRSNLHNCYFYNYIRPNDRIPLIVNSEEESRLREINLGTRNQRDLSEDGMKFKLARKIPGCRPFDVDRSDNPMDSGDKVLSIGAPTPDIRPLPSGHEPVGQFCQIKEPMTFDDGPSVYFSDCSGSLGESGSIQFRRVTVRAASGEIQYKWVAKAMQTRTGYSSLDGDDFNLARGSYTESVGIEGDHLRDVLNGKMWAPDGPL